MFGQRSFNTNTVVANIIIINVLVFVLSWLVMGKQEVVFCGMADYLERAYLYGALFLPTSEWFHPWQLVTHMFLHGNFAHLFFNMFGVWTFGMALEQVWGAKRFLIFYFVSGLGGALTYIAVAYYRLEGVEEIQRCVMEHVPVLGASGAVYGILLAFGMLFPNTELMLLFFPIPIKAKYFVIGYGLIELFGGLQNNPGDNVAHFAHLGGMLFGFILIKIWGKNKGNFY